MTNRPKVVMLTVALALALAVSACANTPPPEANNAQPASDVGPTSEVQSSTTTQEPAELAAADDTTASTAASKPRPSTTLDLANEEAPSEEPETFSEQLDESDYLETQAEPAEVQLVAQNSCENLVDVMVDHYQGLLDDLGPAGRNDTLAVDAAFDGLALTGELITRKTNELGCTEGEVTDLVCAAVGRLRPQGVVGSDLVEVWSENC